jgi:general stress protein YciG
MPDSRNSGIGREDSPNEPSRKSNRGFAAMSSEQQREIARKGGEAVSRNREHMANIGRKGGIASGNNRGVGSTRTEETSSDNNNL